MKRDLFFGRLSTEYVVPPEVHLWRNVVDQVLHDFFKCSSKTTKRDRIEAQAWLRADTEDFFEVCTLAALNPTLTKQRIDSIIEYITEDIDALYNTIPEETPWASRVNRIRDSLDSANILPEKE